MHYRTIADLCDVITTNFHRLPRDVDLVVGIPRSGLMAASFVALGLNVPLADLEGYLQGRVLAAGHTRRNASLDAAPEHYRHVLVVDDSINTGTSIAEARERLARAHPDKQFTFCCVYGLSHNQQGADLVLEVVPQPRAFQWNLMHHPLLARCCVDIDGVLCIDPTEEQNDDGERYVQFLLDAVPLHTPTQPIGYLVTSRLERYRAQTESWLKSRGIVYRELLMLDLPSKRERMAQKAHGSFKGDVYKRLSDTLLFIESDRDQAHEISSFSGKPVLSLGTQELVMPSMLSAVAAAQSVRTLPARLRITQQNKLVPAKRFAQRVLGPSLYGALKRVAHAR